MTQIRRTLLILAAAAAFSACSSSDTRDELKSALNPLARELKGKACEIWEEGEKDKLPHVKGESEKLAYACLGFVHGRDRAWQMDHLRRTSQGRLSEVLGREKLRTDFTMRLLGLHERATQLFTKMNPVFQETLWAYAHGVNQGMIEAITKGVYEFKDLGYGPEPWHPADTIALILLQAFDQTRKGFDQELDELFYERKHLSNTPDFFNPDGLPWDTSILKSGEYATRIGGSAQTAPDERKISSMAFGELAFGDRPGAGAGSNNWVLSAAKSETGRAWLANDPHLDLVHPPFWYWVHVSGGDLDAIGSTLPGVPFIVAGTNQHVAWGVTNSYLDVADLGRADAEAMKGSKSSRPVIWVRLAGLKLPFFFKSFERTAQGWPVLPIEAGGDEAIVLRWTGFDVGPADFAGLEEIMTTATTIEADKAFAKVGIPSWNFVFADDRGTIGYRAVGRIPKRDKAPEYGLAGLSFDKKGEWSSLAPDEMPHVLEPARGFVVSANNRQWPSDSRFHAGRAHAKGFRAFRIEEMLAARPKHDLESIKRIQCDVQAVDARFLLPKMLDALESDLDALQSERNSFIYEELRKWDYVASADCLPCGVYRRWVERVKDYLHMDDVALYRWLIQPLTTPNKDTLVRTYGQALKELGFTEESYPLKPWGELHQATFQHLSGRPAYAVKGIATAGDEHSVNPGSHRFDEEKNVWHHNSGASQRLIVELTRPPVVYSVLAGSQADVEKPDLAAQGSPWQKWANCEFEKRSFPLDWSQVQGAAKIGL